MMLRLKKDTSSIKERLQLIIAFIINSLLNPVLNHLVYKISKE